MGEETVGLEVVGTCGGLTLAGGQVPTKAALSLPSSTGQGEKIKRKARGSR